MRRTAPVLTFLLAACVETAGAPAGAPGALPGPEPRGGDAALDEMCDAEDWRGLLGQNIAAVTLPRSRDLRAFGVDDIVTQEYIPTRTNIVYGRDSVIIRVYCG